MKKLIKQLKANFLKQLHKFIMNENQAAFYLGISESFLQKLNKQKAIKAIYFNNKCYQRNALDRWISSYKIENPFYKNY